MLKLMKQYPLIGIIIVIMSIGIVTIFSYNRWQERHIQITEIEKEVKEDSLANTPVEDRKDSGTEQQKLSVCKNAEQSKVDSEPADMIEGNTQKTLPSRVPVYICGDVKRPGVYYISSNAIIDDVIKISGGFTEEADVIAVNLASPIIANEKIIIPKVGEEIDKLVESYDNIEVNERKTLNREIYTGDHNSQGNLQNDPNEREHFVNINTANKEVLMTLPGIGAVKASAIIAYREEHGTFDSKEELKNVSGIGDKTYEKLAQLITT